MNKLIAVTGPIAAGATTLAKKLTGRNAWQPVLEADVETVNPFFRRYGADPARWAFHNQVAFLTKSAELHAAMRVPSATVLVQDYTPFEHVGVYANVQRQSGLLQPDEFALIERLSRAVESLFIVPLVLVYRPIDRSALKTRVDARARPSEAALTPEFLEAVADRFDAWISEWTLSPVLRLAPTFDVDRDIGELERIEHEVSKL